jgi:hypothetical protein
MTNRREFLQTGVSVSALPLAIGGLPSSMAADVRREPEPLSPHKAIFDDRYAEGRAFAAAIGRFGVPARALTNGDITDLWYDELDLVWRTQRVAVAGLTQFGPMFALERLGNDRGMRVVLRVEHQLRADGTLAHVMTGAAETLAAAEQLQRRGVDWPTMIAATLAHCRADRAAPAECTIVMPAAKPELTPPPAAAASSSAPETVIHYYTTAAIQEGRGIPWDGALFSWVIAPVAKG